MIPALALLGGPRTCPEPFPPVACLDSAEEEAVLAVLRSRLLSGFVGSTSANIAALLAMTSAEAVAAGLPDYSFLGGRVVRQFEADFAAFSGVPFAISNSTATGALSLALAACGVGPGDEVITTCMSFTATGASVLTFNSIPVFVDVSPENYCLDPAAVERAITPATKAILVVHLYGLAADMDALMDIARRHGLAVVEDCSQAIGTRHRGRLVGTIGDAGVYSFNHQKNITTGEGGMIVTHRADVARHTRLTRNHGEVVPTEDWDDDALSNVLGFNMRMTEMTAAVGVAQLRKLEENNRVRNENGAALRARLSAIPFLSFQEIPAHTEPCLHVLAAHYDAEAAGVPRADVVRALAAEGVPVGCGYPRLMHEHPMFTRGIVYGTGGYPFTAPGARRPAYGRGVCPFSEKITRENLLTIALLHRPCTTAHMASVSAAFAKVFAQLDVLKSWPERTPKAF